MSVVVERISTGVPGLDRILSGGIPKGFLVALAGEPGTGKTILCIHFVAIGLQVGDPCVYVTTEESRESVIRQAAQFGFDFQSGIRAGKLILIDALMREKDRWSLQSLDIEELVQKVIDAKKKLGRGHARLVIDSMSAFWLDRPAMARRYSYQVKRVLTQWNFTIMATTQYAITTAEAFGFGLEHIADGIIRFRKRLIGGRLCRFIICEKMRQTPHDLRAYEIDIIDGRGLVVKHPLRFRVEDTRLPYVVLSRILRAKRRAEEGLTPRDRQE